MQGEKNIVRKSCLYIKIKRNKRYKMSTNRKNRINPAFLKNFTENVERRCIAIESSQKAFDGMQEFVNSINETANIIIQELNLKIHDRQLPYITLTVQYNNTDLKYNTRFLYHSNDTNLGEQKRLNAFLEKTLGIDISHMIDIMVADGYKELVISSVGSDSKIVVDRDFFKCAIIDVLLDIVMFNSYSFLREMSVCQRHEFSYKKNAFYKNQNLKCFYEDKAREDVYFSFAFAARVDENVFDSNVYIETWDSFVKNNYGGCVHVELPIQEQLKMHSDFDELPNNVHEKFDNYPKGAYLLLRTNKGRTESIEPHIIALFETEDVTRGKITIVNIGQFDNVKDLLINLDVSAFKIVKN